MSDLTTVLETHIDRVGEMSDDELMESSLHIERALIHMLVEQQMRMSASVSPLRAV